MYENHFISFPTCFKKKNSMFSAQYDLTTNLKVTTEVPTVEFIICHLQKRGYNFFSTSNQFIYIFIGSILGVHTNYVLCSRWSDETTRPARTIDSRDEFIQGLLHSFRLNYFTVSICHLKHKTWLSRMLDRDLELLSYISRKE